MDKTQSLVETSAYNAGKKFITQKPAFSCPTSTQTDEMEKLLRKAYLEGMIDACGLLKQEVTPSELKNAIAKIQTKEKNANG